MGEFTGERVIPGEVDIDLLNEHVARYAFAARLARGKRVLDMGCGSGYGAARLAAVARRVVGLEISAAAVDAARRRYAAPGLEFLCGDCRALSFPDGSFDRVVAFEVIEHLEEWERLLAEARRVLTASGQLIVSTPNRVYYAESRGPSNPFHVHEFDYEEFRAVLEAHFPQVRVFLENHADALVFSLPDANNVETVFESPAAEPNESHFFVAVCSGGPLDRSSAFVYLPESGNVLREREKHISLLAGELEKKDCWLEETKESLDNLHREHQALEREAAQERLRAQEIVNTLEQENARKTEWCLQVEAEVERLKGLLAELRAEFDQRTKWVEHLEAERLEILAGYQRLDEEAVRLRSDLKACVDQLHATEAELDQRTAWALGLDRQVQQLTADLNSLFGSPAYRIGRRLGLAPTPPSDPRARQ